MPYPNEHAARIKDPGLFDPSSFRSKDLKGGVRIVLGKLKNGNDSMVVQTYRFSIDQFTVEEAKQWLKDNDVSFIKFEPASEEEIEHTGVLGMKWGVRKNKSSSQDTLTVTRTPTKGPSYVKVQRYTKLKNKGSDSTEHTVYSAIKKKKVQDMTDDELSFLTKRATLVSLYKRSGSITKKKVREMSNVELQGHVDRYNLRKGILKNPMRRWKIKDFVKTYKLSDADSKKLLDRVNAENRYYDVKNANLKSAQRYVKMFLDTNP